MTGLLTDQARSWIGREIVVDGDEVTEAMVQQFVYASEDAHPAYLSETTATDAGVERVAPPMLYQAAIRPYVPLDHYNSDGTVREVRPPLGTGQSMGGTLEVEWIRPLRVGDRLCGVRKLVALEEKSGSRRDFVIVRWQTEYRDQKGELVIREQYEQIVF